MTAQVPRILCISLSPIYRDARVLRQISVLQEFGAVTTVGYGDQPAGATEHVRVPDGLASLPQTPAGVANLALRRMRASELAAPAVGFARKRLAHRSFDLVVANDARVLALAFDLAGAAPVWADMHEWAPEERTHVLSWRLLVAPLMDHLCRVYLPSAAAVTTIGDEIAALYAHRYSVAVDVVRNAAPYSDLAPSPLETGRIRLVHSGGAVPGRNIEGMIDAVARLDERFTLDLYLVTAGTADRYAQGLRERVGDDPRVRFHDPVAPTDLPATLNAYDVGVFWMPPVHTNGRLTLPNKLFDFVQARLAIAIGPTVEMERIVREYDLGVVSDSFDLADCVASLSALTAEAVEGYKRQAHSAARDLSFEHEREITRSIVARLLDRR